MEKEQRQSILLAVLYLLGEYGREKEVSRGEFVECIFKLQKTISLGYKFEESVPYYSHLLSSDLKDLYFNRGCITDKIQIIQIPG